MSLQPLNARSLRRLNRQTGIEFVAARVWSNYIAVAVTDQHVHYRIDRQTGIASLEDPPICWTSCRDRFDFEPFLPGVHGIPPNAPDHPSHQRGQTNTGAQTNTLDQPQRPCDARTRNGRPGGTVAREGARPDVEVSASRQILGEQGAVDPRPAQGELQTGAVAPIVRRGARLVPDAHPHPASDETSVVAHAAGAERLDDRAQGGATTVPGDVRPGDADRRP